MRFSTLTLILTDRCNFSCSYCYQRKNSRQIPVRALTKALDFLYPRLTKEGFVNFYGGEPLLAFDRLQRTVHHLERLNGGGQRRIRYSLSTNGSLLDDEVLRFLDEHAFSLLLSFDGTAQDEGREKGSFDRLVALIPEILNRPRIRLETNSVFTAETIGRLSSSLRLLLRLGVPRFHAGITSRGVWTADHYALLKKEMAAARALFLARFGRLADVPWIEMAKPDREGIYRCDAGREQLALAADGRLWGCFLFPHYFDGNGRRSGGEELCFGDIDAFLADPEAIYARAMRALSRLGMVNARTPEKSCVMCEEIHSCWICPLAAAFSSGTLGEITSQTCGLARIVRREKGRFRKAFRDKRRASGPRVRAARSS
jgi:MoaA/NifB/PqqE/SkfB family radical SAM enzyme